MSSVPLGFKIRNIHKMVVILQFSETAKALEIQSRKTNFKRICACNVL